MGKETQSVAGILTGGFLPKYDVVLRFLTILSCGLKNTQGVLCALINANTSPVHPVSSASKSYLDHEIKVTLLSMLVLRFFRFFCAFLCFFFPKFRAVFGFWDPSDTPPSINDIDEFSNHIDKII